MGNQVVVNARARIVILAGTSNDFPSQPETVHYFDTAEKFWKQDTGVKIMTIPDLAGILNYLRTTSDNGSRPFGDINIVSHGNSSTWWVREVPDGPNVDRDKNFGQTAKSLTDMATRLTAPGASVIDATTRIVLRGCNLGKHDDLLKAVAKLFGSRATVFAPKLAVVYRFATDGKLVERLADEWQIFTKTVPNAAEAKAALVRAYPNERERVERVAAVTNRYGSTADSWVDRDTSKTEVWFEVNEEDTLKSDSSVVFDPKKQSIVTQFVKQWFATSSLAQHLAFDDFRNPAGSWKVEVEFEHKTLPDGRTQIALYAVKGELVCERTEFTSIRVNETPDTGNSSHYGSFKP